MEEFVIRHNDTYWECKFTIDTEIALPAIKEMVEFWGGHESRLEDNDGDYLKTFAVQLGREIFLDVITNNHNLRGVLSHFNTAEGWIPMDGSQGIEITDVDDVEFDYDEFEIR